MDYLIKGATINSSHRYFISRIWDLELPTCCFIGLNPSTGDATTDDPIIHQCVSFANSHGFGGIEMVNLFPYRSISLDTIRMREPEPEIDEQNYTAITAAIGRSETVIACWGDGGSCRGTGEKILADFPGLLCVGLTPAGQPAEIGSVKGCRTLALVSSIRKRSERPLCQ